MQGDTPVERWAGVIAGSQGPIPSEVGLCAGIDAQCLLEEYPNSKVERKTYARSEFFSV